MVIAPATSVSKTSLDLFTVKPYPPASPALHRLREKVQPSKSGMHASASHQQEGYPRRQMLRFLVSGEWLLEWCRRPERALDQRGGDLLPATSSTTEARRRERLLNRIPAAEAQRRVGGQHAPIGVEAVAPPKTI
jgi:hypothetical protein